MNSQELWNKLENMSIRDIQTLISLSIRYLEQKRNVKFKVILGDIKNVHKFLESHI